MNYPSLRNCSGEEIAKALTRLGGFSVKDGSKHFYKVTHPKLPRPFMLPKRKPLKTGLIWDLIRNFIIPAGYTEEQIFKEIWC